MQKMNAPSWWYKKKLIGFLWLPFSYIYQIIIFCRKFYYLHLAQRVDFSVPVIVVGNITFGGTGKTPFVIWLVNLLLNHGFRPGVISRGYGGKNNRTPHQVVADDTPVDVGDEAVMLKDHLNCPIVIARNRVAAGKYLLANNNCNIIIADDGLQHYALKRNLEIAVVDGVLKFGNHLCFPAGPLREPISRLLLVDFIIVNGDSAEDLQLETKKNWSMELRPQKIVNLKNPKLTKDLEQIKNLPIKAYAGIGNPERFFRSLRNFGLQIESKAYPDHYQFKAEDFAHCHDLVLMTEKDAVKCLSFATDKFWYLPVQAVLEEGLAEMLLQRIGML